MGWKASSGKRTTRNYLTITYKPAIFTCCHYIVSTSWHFLQPKLITIYFFAFLIHRFYAILKSCLEATRINQKARCTYWELQDTFPSSISLSIQDTQLCLLILASPSALLYMSHVNSSRVPHLKRLTLDPTLYFK